MKRDKRKRIAAAVIALVIVLLMVVSMAGAVLAAEQSGAVSSGSAQQAVSLPAAGVYLDNLEVSQLTKEAATEAVQQRQAELSADVIVLYAGGQSARTTAGGLGLSLANPEVIDQAVSIGRQGNILKRFRAKQRLAGGKAIFLDLKWQVSEEKVRQVLTDSLAALNCEASANGLRLNDDGTFSLKKGRDGVQVSVEPSVQRIMQYMQQEWHGGAGGVTLDAHVTPAADGTADLSKIGDLLGSAQTQYATGNLNHDTNVEIAASHIDGTLVYPGEEFSAEKVIGPTTKEYGFLPGDSFEGGEVVQTYGGGVCQTTTTLYNAVLQAELDVTERHNHASLVSYVEPGFDAAIAEGQQDFRFKNNTSVPIYIQGVTDGSTLAFRIYGCETRAKNRSISYYSEESDPVEVTYAYKTDAEAALGELTTSGGIRGTDAALHKVVTVDGAQTSDEVITQSHYAMMPYTYTVGTKGADAKTLQAVQQAAAAKDLAGMQAAAGGAAYTAPAEDGTDDAAVYGGYDDGGDAYDDGADWSGEAYWDDGSDWE